MPRFVVPALVLSLLLAHALPGAAAESSSQSAVRAPRTESSSVHPSLHTPGDSKALTASETPLDLNAGTLLVLSLAVMGLHLARRSGQSRR